MEIGYRIGSKVAAATRPCRPADRRRASDRSIVAAVSRRVWKGFDRFRYGCPEELNRTRAVAQERQPHAQSKRRSTRPGSWLPQGSSLPGGRSCSRCFGCEQRHHGVAGAPPRRKWRASSSPAPVSTKARLSNAKSRPSPGARDPFADILPRISDVSPVAAQSHKTGYAFFRRKLGHATSRSVLVLGAVGTK